MGGSSYLNYSIPTYPKLIEKNYVFADKYLLTEKEWIGIIIHKNEPLCIVISVCEEV